MQRVALEKKRDLMADNNMGDLSRRINIGEFRVGELESEN